MTLLATSRLSQLALAGIVLSLSIGSLVALAENATVGVYFESRCPDSKRFVLNQLLPTYRDIGDIFKPMLVAFGHARTLGSNKMICQHGPRECEGNRLMACIQAYGKSDSEVLETIGCLFENRLSPQECVKKHLGDVSYERLDKCKTSDESYQMMVENEKLTGRVSYVPHLTFNGAQSEDIQSELEHNLKSYICKQHAGAKPDRCKEAEKSEE